MKNTTKLALLCTAFVVNNTQAWVGTTLKLTAKTSILLTGYATLKTIENNGIIYDEAAIGYPELPATERAHYERVKELFREQWNHFKTGCKNLKTLQQFPLFIKTDLEKALNNFKAKHIGQEVKTQENKPEEIQNNQEQTELSDSQE